MMQLKLKLLSTFRENTATQRGGCTVIDNHYPRWTLLELHLLLLLTAAVPTNDAEKIRCDRRSVE